MLVLREMLRDWWAAHRLELVVELVVLAVALALFLVAVGLNWLVGRMRAGRKRRLLIRDKERGA